MTTRETFACHVIILNEEILAVGGAKREFVGEVTVEAQIGLPETSSLPKRQCGTVRNDSLGFGDGSRPADLPRSYVIRV